MASQAHERHVRDTGAAAPPLRGPSAAETTSALLDHVLRELPARVDDAALAGDAAQPAASGRASLASARAGRFRESGRSLAGALYGDWSLAEAYFVRGEASLEAALAAAAVRRDAADAARKVITTHHRRLRAGVAQAAEAAAQVASSEEQEAAEAARRVAWAAALADEPALEAYAGAAAETGRRSWARASQRWCLETARDFFSIGAGRTAAKAARASHFAAHGATMPPDAVAAAAAAAQEAVRAAVGEGRKPRLVDIGSCFDPWRAHEDEFEARSTLRLARCAPGLT